MRLFALGFFGYYLSSFVNFAGLRLISVGLERIILYTYPSLVLLGGVLFYRKTISLPVIVATAVSYTGILCAFLGEAQNQSQSRRWTELALGSGLVFLSAISYALFILMSGDAVQRLGPTRFTSCAVGISCGLILVHFGVTHPLASLFAWPRAVYGYGLVLAIVGTVVPAYLLGVGLKRTTAQKFAVMGTVGPVVTLLLAWAILGEPLRAMQGLGFVFSLAGGVAVSRFKEVPGR